MASAVACLALGCQGAQNVLAPAGPGARNLAFLARVSLLPFLAVTAVTWAVLLTAALRRRGSLEHHDRSTSVEVRAGS